LYLVVVVSLIPVVKLEKPRRSSCRILILSLVLPIVTAVLAGCGHSPIGIYPNTVLNPYEVVVFGRVDAYRDARPMKWAERMLKDDGTCDLIVRHRTNRQDFGYYIQPDGYFFWRLMPGDYVLKEFHLMHMLKGNLWGYFDVPINAKAMYIGTLRIQFKMGTPTYRMRVENDFDKACEVLKERCPQAEGKPERSLMRLGLESESERN